MSGAARRLADRLARQTMGRGTSESTRRALASYMDMGCVLAVHAGCAAA